MIKTEPMRGRRIDTTEKGAELLDALREEIRITAGMAIEMLETNKVTLLSPICREMLLTHAKRLEELRVKLDNYLCVDYLQDI